MTDAEIERLHGDHRRYSIAAWRRAKREGETGLDYIDWRADRLWCAAQG